MGLVTFFTKVAMLLTALTGNEPPMFDPYHTPEPVVQEYKKPYTILVEGNVGSGKSTLLKFFSNHPEIDIVFEPVAKWQNVSGTNLLDKMFHEQKQWSGAFQLYSSLTRYSNDLKKTDKKLRIMERSVYSERYCFLETMRESGGISNAEYNLMIRWFSLMTKELGEKLKPDLISK